jgi:hypothetical protein
MRRRLFNFVSGMSLLACMAVATLWGRSFSGIDEVLRRDASTIRFRSAAGRVMIEVVSWREPSSDRGSLGWSYRRSPSERPSAASLSWS